MFYKSKINCTHKFAQFGQLQFTSQIGFKLFFVFNGLSVGNALVYTVKLFLNIIQNSFAVDF